MHPLRDFAFSCDDDRPAGASLRDAQLSYPRCVDGVAAAVNATPTLRIPIDTTHRSVVHSLELRLSARWDGEEPGVMCGVRESMLTHATYARRFRVQLSSEVFKGGTLLCSMNALSHLEIPAIVDDGRPPPESGHFVVYGREYIIRERFAFGNWIVTSKKGVTVSMRSPPAYPGTVCVTTRIVGHVITAGTCARDRKHFSLAGLLVLLGVSNPEEYAGLVGDAAFDIRAIAGAWPSSRADAVAAFRDAMRMRFPPAPGLGIAERSVEDLIREWILPHVPDARKVACLAHGSALLARAALDDLDHMVNKRFDAPGDLLATASGAHWHRLWSCIPKRLAVGRQKWTGPPADCAKALAAAGLEGMRAIAIAASEKIQDGFSTPDWTAADGNKISGVCEKVTRINAAYHISLMRCSRSAMGANGSRKREPRLPHGSSDGLVCPMFATDDDMIGLVKMFSSTTRTSDTCDVYGWLPPVSREGCWHVIVDGVRIGRVEDAPAFAAAFRKNRLSQIRIAARAGNARAVFSLASVACTQRTQRSEVHVRASEGRLVRPLLVAGHPPARLESLTQLLCEGAVEYLDAGAIDDATLWVVETYEHLERCTAEAAAGGYLPPSHVEFHPAAHLGPPATSVPFSHHNQSTRNNFYVSSQCKQPFGVPHPGWLSWKTINKQVLLYPQRPLVTAAGESAMRGADLPAGTNVLMMIGFLDGFNQEDALVMNGRSLENGMFHSLQYDAYSKDRVCSTNEEDAQSKERVPSTNHHNDDDGLDDDGTVPLLTVVGSGKTVGHDEKSGAMRHSLRSAARVESVLIANAPSILNPHRSTVVVFKYRETEVGDKYCSRHGQKGVIGYIAHPWSLPFEKGTGLQPDLIINANAFPSRMTVGHLLEMVGGLVGLAEGKIMDATTYDSLSLEELRARLQARGLQPGGGVVMVDPVTNAQLPGLHIIAPIYYLRMKHQVQDKIMAQSSATGGLDVRTMQPLQGAARNGALRVGEMEQDAYISWGMLVGLHERFLSQSDGCVSNWCRTCGLPATDLLPRPGERLTRKQCNACAERATRNKEMYVPNVASVFMSRASLVVLLTLLSMGIAARPEFQEDS